MTVDVSTRGSGGSMGSMIASAPTKGRLLIATPPLEDPNFDRTVIYVLEHHDDEVAAQVSYADGTALVLYVTKQNESQR